MVKHPTLPLALVLLLAGLLRPAAPQDDARGAVKRVSMAWRDGITPERLMALDQLAHFDDPVCVDEMVEILGRGEIAMFPTVRRILGGYVAPASVKRIVDRGLGSRDPVVRTQVLLALGDSRPSGVDWVALTVRALDDPLPPVRAAAVSALGRARIDSALTRITELAGDPSERVRREVPTALQRLAGSRCMPVLDGLLRDPRWRVRLSALRALADLKTREATARLVDALAVEPGRLREDITDLLARLTGQNLGADVPVWRQFLATAPADFLEHGDSVALGQVAPPRYADAPVRYYGIGTLSRRFVLVNDLSGSMDTPVPIAGHEDLVPRLVATQQEITRLIGTLQPDISFDLITFRDEAKLWKEHLVAADDRNRHAALKEVDGYKAFGPTNIHAALTAVFDMAERTIDAPAAAEEDDVDTLYLLTDGVATIGAIRDADLLLQYVAERNRTLQLRIHCLSLTDEPGARDFLTRLATQGGGRYVELVK